MNKQKHIIIIHSSVVTRKGLRAILKDFPDARFTLVSSPQEVNSDLWQNDADMLFIVEKDLVPEFLDARGREDNYITFSADHGELNYRLTEEEILEVVAGHLQTESEYGGEGNSHGLSQREVEILRNVAMGYSNKEIADRLFISTHTVISHRKNITEKLGIRSISGLTLYAFLNRIIDPEQLSQTDLI